MSRNGLSRWTEMQKGIRWRRSDGAEVRRDYAGVRPSKHSPWLAYRDGRNPLTVLRARGMSRRPRRWPTVESAMQALDTKYPI
jgi:hypothetical protein